MNSNMISGCFHRVGDPANYRERPESGRLAQCPSAREAGLLAPLFAAALVAFAAVQSAWAEDYYWQGADSAGNWSAPSSWGRGDDDANPYPNATDAKMITWGDSDANIVVDGQFNIGQADLYRKMEMSGNGPENSSVTANGNSNFLASNPFMLNNIRWNANGFPYLGSGSCLVLTNHAEFVVNYSGGMAWYEASSSIELHDNARLVSNVRMQFLKANQAIVIDDSEFIIGEQGHAFSLAEGDGDRNGQKIEFRGTHPKLRVRWQIRSGVDDSGPKLTNKPEFVFHVPLADYEAVPFAAEGNLNHFEFNVGGGQGMKFTVDPKSPRFRRHEHTWEKLLSWPEGILTDLLTIDEQENSRVTLYWAYGAGGKDDKEPTYEGEKPTALWAEFTPAGFAVIVQ